LPSSRPIVFSFSGNAWFSIPRLAEGAQAMLACLAISGFRLAVLDCVLCAAPGLILDLLIG